MDRYSYYLYQHITEWNVCHLNCMCQSVWDTSGSFVVRYIPWDSHHQTKIADRTTHIHIHVIFTHICILIMLWLFYIQSIELHTYCISPIYDEVAVLFSSGHEESMVSFILLYDSWAGKSLDNMFEVMVGNFWYIVWCLAAWEAVENGLINRLG